MCMTLPILIRLYHIHVLSWSRVVLLSVSARAIVFICLLCAAPICSLFRLAHRLVSTTMSLVSLRNCCIFARRVQYQLSV